MRVGVFGVSGVLLVLGLWVSVARGQAPPPAADDQIELIVDDDVPVVHARRPPPPTAWRSALAGLLVIGGAACVGLRSQGWAGR